MVLYRCNHCNKKYHNKYDYIRHCNRKTPCIETDDTRTKPQSCVFVPHKTAECAEKITHDELVIKCNTCNKKFTRKDTLQRHIKKYCQQTQNYDQKINNLQQQINELKKRNKQLVVCNNTNNKAIATNCNNTNNITNNNNIVINNNNVVLTEFSMEAYDRLSIQDKIDIINKGYYCLEECLKKIHLNDKIPEYMNVYIPDLSSNMGYIVGEDGKWTTERIDEIVYRSLGDMESHLDFYIQDNRVTSKCDKTAKLDAKDQLKKVQVFTNTINATKNNIKKLYFDHHHKIPVRLDDLPKSLRQ
jgi:uncharacterized C2H2 Zn-finger protein